MRAIYCANALIKNSSIISYDSQIRAFCHVWFLLYCAIVFLCVLLEMRNIRICIPATIDKTKYEECGRSSLSIVDVALL